MLRDFKHLRGQRPYNRKKVPGNFYILRKIRYTGLSVVGLLYVQYSRCSERPGGTHNQIRNKLVLSFVSLGEMNFKNIQQLVGACLAEPLGCFVLVRSPRIVLVRYFRTSELSGRWKPSLGKCRLVN
jgi:hypothetical protein